MSYVGRIFQPILWLGIGIGVAAGFSLTTGLAFTMSDGARFLGSLFGSIIAVGSAVSLYYLKETDDRRRQRRHLVKLCDAGYSQCQVGHSKIEDYDADSANVEPIASNLLALALHIRRVKRIFERFEYEDDRISEAAFSFDKNFADRFENFSSDENLADRLDVVDQCMLFTAQCFSTAKGVLLGESRLGPKDVEAEIE